VSSSARSHVRHAWKKTGAAFVLVSTALLFTAGSWAKTSAIEPGNLQRTVNAGQLPQEAVATLKLIHQGGPFAHAKDGTVFGNRERLLPASARGYYREYTVPTRGLRHRGAKRIVCGGRQPTAPDACFYTSDHYASFSRIVQ
jgi:ribonuclease T1